MQKQLCCISVILLGGMSESSCWICSSWLSNTSGTVNMDTRPFASPRNKSFTSRPSPLMTRLQRTAGGHGSNWKGRKCRDTNWTIVEIKQTQSKLPVRRTISKHSRETGDPPQTTCYGILCSPPRNWNGKHNQDEWRHLHAKLRVKNTNRQT